jgi:hypothetical protein
VFDFAAFLVSCFIIIIRWWVRGGGRVDAFQRA